MEQEENFQRYNVFKINIEYYFIFIIVLVLSILGIVMVSSASIAVGEKYFNDAFYFIRRQAVWWVISIGALLLFSRVNYRFYSKISLIFLLVCIALLAVVLIPGVAPVIGGARRWFNLFFFNIQPSEIAKLGLVIFICDSLNRRYINRMSFKNIFWPSFIILLVVTLLIFLEPDFGTVVVIWITVFILFFVGNVRFPHIISLGGIGLVVLVAYMFMEEYRRQRIFAFFSSSSHSESINFQINQSLIALGSGHLLGSGLGNSIQKYSYLPEAHTDFIFAIIGEELGIAGTIGVVVLFIAFAFFAVRICQKTKDYYGRVIAGGLAGMIISQAIINIAVVTGLLPV
ncbi:MAG: cell division protein FtsW, partial [Actinobacteria bacterium]|nr:cell division protein FtsW [Actinomycetota bacterium]